MKKFVLNFKGFVNENYEENFERVDDADSGVATSEMPEEVSKIANMIINGNFEGAKVLSVSNSTIKVQATDQDFKYAPDMLALRDFGFETWSSKPYDVKLSLEDADPSKKELIYKIEFVEKEGIRRKVNPEDQIETPGSDDDEYYKPEDYGDVPEEPEDVDSMVGDTDGDGYIDRGEFLDDDDEEELMENRKKKVSGGFETLKIKKAPRYSNPNNKARREENKKRKASGFRKGATKKIMKKDPEKMVEIQKDNDKK